MFPVGSNIFVVCFYFSKNTGWVQIFIFSEEFVDIAQLFSRVDVAEEKCVASYDFSHYRWFFFYMDTPNICYFSLVNLLISVLILLYQIFRGYDGSVKLWFKAFSFAKRFSKILRTFFLFHFFGILLGMSILHKFHLQHLSVGYFISNPFSKSTPLWNNLYTIKCTHFKFTVGWVSVNM